MTKWKILSIALLTGLYACDSGGPARPDGSAAEPSEEGDAASGDEDSGSDEESDSGGGKGEDDAATGDPEPGEDAGPGEEDAGDTPDEEDAGGHDMDGGGEPEEDASGEVDADVEVDAGSDAGPPPTPWYACQSSDQAFVRSAILAVLGRRPYSQAEVNVYADLIQQIDEADGVNTVLNAPGSKLRHSRKVLLELLFDDPQYNKHWEELYRDFIRVQRVDEQHLPGCFAAPLSADPVAVAAHIRRKPATDGAGGPGEFTMYDVVQGAIALDDVSPIYTSNIFAMLTETYVGANAEPVALELTRRRDFGAWFDAVYLHRDAVCLNCHNSEFSVTQSSNPATNRHYPVPALLEKSLFGSSTGPASFGGFEGGDRMHAPLRYKDFVNDCTTRTQTQQQAGITCPSPTELVYRCLNERICESEYKKRGTSRPWGWAEVCGKYTAPEKVPVDIAAVEAKFGNLTGLRTSPWGLAEALRQGFAKLRTEGLKPGPKGQVDDPDKAFAYLVAMSIAEKAWLQIVGTPLTIPTRYPRNAAARDQLAYLTEVFVSSGFSNQKLIEAVLASPYANVSSPTEGCGDAYAMPAIFDPWVIAESDPIKRKNSAADGVVSLTARTASSALYKALGWPTTIASAFPDTSRVGNNDPMRPIVQAERNFQGETGFYLKNSEPGFRGFDFQARLGWEDRFAVCAKIPSATGPDFIDGLVSSVSSPNKGTLGDVVAVMKDRLVGRSSIEPMAEAPAIEAIFGAPLATDASAVTDLGAGLRKLCGVIASSPQFLLVGLSPPDAESVPKLTPYAATYGAICSEVESKLNSDVTVTCHDDGSLSIHVR